MNAIKRSKNEKEFDKWKELDTGGRIYSFEISGRTSGKAIYLKEVDKEETTIRFWQEIYNANNELIEMHEKFPRDTGHKKVKHDNR